MTIRARRLALACVGWLLLGSTAVAQTPEGESAVDEILLDTMHSISSHVLFDAVVELSSEKYGGRLTGTEAYNAAADWVAGHLKS